MIQRRAARPTATTALTKRTMQKKSSAALDERDAACGTDTSGHRSAIDGRRIRHSRLCRQPAHRQAHPGGARLDQDGRVGQEKTSAFTLAAAAYNLVRLPRLIAEAG